MVSVLSFYSDDPSLNPAGYLFIRQDEKTKKVQGLAHLKKQNNFLLQVVDCQQEIRSSQGLDAASSQEKQGKALVKALSHRIGNHSRDFFEILLFESFEIVRGFELSLSTSGNKSPFHSSAEKSV